MTLRLLAIASLLIPGALLTAQTERITVRMAPAPNQTLHLRTTQETNMTMEPDPPGSSSAIPPTTVHIALTLEHTSTVGPTDARGHYQARLVVDRATATMTMNGQPSPIAPPMTGVVGQVITFSYDDQGTVVDVTMEGELAANAAESIKQLLTSALSAAPPMTLAVGESTTTPTQLSMPLPAARASWR